MLKLAIAAVVASVAGTTAYVVHDSRSGAAPAAPVASSAAAAEAAPTPGGAAVRAAPAPGAPPAPHLPGARDPAAAGAAGEADTPPCGTCKDKPADSGDAADAADEIVPPETIARLGLERGPSRGAADAPVSVVVFTDVKCKFCGAALGLLDQMLDDYEGKIRLVVKQLPLSPKTELLSQALYAAEAQGKFWELHDLMLAHQDDLTQASMLALAPQAGLDVSKLRAAIDQGTYRGKLDADKAAAAELKVRGTPAFFINGHRVIGLASPADFRAVIDRVLAERR
jgi:protein-disulfide isomerase